jgi:formylglycine-generating enzyme required for sulfatase activity
VDSVGLHLPSEAQWEYAARVGSNTPFYCGAQLDSSTDANFNGTAAGGGNCGYQLRNVQMGQTKLVGSYLPNGFGLYELLGNVYEYCEDIYNADFYSTPEASDPDPVSTTGSEARVRRGGAYDDAAETCRSALRNRFTVERSARQVGFRVVAPMPGKRSLRLFGVWSLCSRPR